MDGRVGVLFPSHRRYTDTPTYPATLPARTNLVQWLLTHPKSCTSWLRPPCSGLPVLTLIDLVLSQVQRKAQLAIKYGKAAQPEIVYMTHESKQLLLHRPHAVAKHRVIWLVGATRLRDVVQTGESIWQAGSLHLIVSASKQRICLEPSVEERAREAGCSCLTLLPNINLPLQAWLLLVALEDVHEYIFLHGSLVASMKEQELQAPPLMSACRDLLCMEPTEVPAFRAWMGAGQAAWIPNIWTLALGSPASEERALSVSQIARIMPAAAVTPHQSQLLMQLDAHVAAVNSLAGAGKSTLACALISYMCRKVPSTLVVLAAPSKRQVEALACKLGCLSGGTRFARMGVSENKDQFEIYLDRKAPGSSNDCFLLAICCTL